MIHRLSASSTKVGDELARTGGIDGSFSSMMTPNKKTWWCYKSFLDYLRVALMISVSKYNLQING